MAKIITNVRKFLIPHTYACMYVYIGKGDCGEPRKCGSQSKIACFRSHLFAAEI